MLGPAEHDHSPTEAQCKALKCPSLGVWKAVNASSIKEVFFAGRSQEEDNKDVEEPRNQVT